MKLYFKVPPEADGMLLRGFLRRCSVSTDLSRAVKFRGSGFFADGAPVLANRRVSREVAFSELPEDSMEQLASYDRYPWEYTFFPVGGDVILIEDDRLAEALNALPQDGRDILLMYFFLDMADREIAERMNMARRTVNARRQKAYRLLKELMGGDVDG